MAAIETLITENIDVWSTAIKKKASAGRGSSRKQEFYGIKRLRELILELAVRGLLVPQDPNAESAKDLLSMSVKAKELLLQSGRVKPSRSKKNIKEEHFYSYPESWVSAKLEDLMNVINGR